MEYNSTMSGFTNWLVTTKKLAESTSKSYSSSIKTSENYHQGSIDLFLPDSETVNVITEIFNNPTFVEDNKYKHNTMSSALKLYVEYLTSSSGIELLKVKSNGSSQPEKLVVAQGSERVPLENSTTPLNDSNETKSILSILLEQFVQIEKEQRKIVLDSYDIEDQEESIRTEQLASSNIRKIRQWKSDLTQIFTEMSEVGFSFELPNTSSQRESPTIRTVEDRQTSKTLVEPHVDDKPTVTTAPMNPPVVEKPKANPVSPEAPSKEQPVTEPPPSMLTQRQKSSKPIQYQLFRITYSVNYWNELFVSFCEVMLAHKPEIVSTFDRIPDFKTRSRINFSYNKEDIIFTPKQLANGMWIETNRSAQNISALCYKILNLCGFDESDLVIFVEDSTPSAVAGHGTTPLPQTESALEKKVPTAEQEQSENRKIPVPEKEIITPPAESPNIKPEKIAVPPTETSATKKAKVTEPPIETSDVTKGKVSVQPVELSEGEQTRVTTPSIDTQVEEKLKDPTVETSTSQQVNVTASPRVELTVVSVPPVETLITEILPDVTSLEVSTINSSGTISEMWLLGSCYKFESAIDFFVKVCEMMVLHRPYAIGTFHENKLLKPERQVNFSYQKSDIGLNCVQLNNGLWMNKQQEESNIVTLCHTVVSACGFGENDLKFTLKGG